MINIKIERLIPQRAPVMMVDALLEAEDDRAMTSLVVRSDNYFMADDGCLSESGLIEHIAQSASAFAGYKAFVEGAENPPVGYIGEVKKFRCHCRPRIGDRLQTTVAVIAESDGVTLIQGETCVNDRPVADTQMKIFIKQ